MMAAAPTLQYHHQVYIIYISLLSTKSTQERLPLQQQQSTIQVNMYTCIASEKL